MMPEETIKIILDEAFYIHKTIGPGMLENVYKTCLAYLIRKRGLFVETEKPIPVYFEEVKMDCGYRADIVVENSVIVDTKTIEAIGIAADCSGVNLSTVSEYSSWTHLKLSCVVDEGGHSKGSFWVLIYVVFFVSPL
jgi:GxxExxY protein